MEWGRGPGVVCRAMVLELSGCHKSSPQFGSTAKPGDANLESLGTACELCAFRANLLLLHLIEAATLLPRPQGVETTQGRGLAV